MTEHIDEHTLELLILSPESVSAAEKQKVEAHLELCSLCREHRQRLSAFYQTLDEKLDSPPTQRDREFAENLFARRRKALPERGLELSRESLRETLDTYAEVIEPYRRSALQRFVRWARFNPIKFAGATTVAVAALALLTMTVRRPKDTNPVLAEAKKGMLRVYNKEGEELWSRTAPKISDGSTRFGFEDSPHDPQFVTIEDIDGDGRNEVLVTGLTTLGMYGLDSLYCFEGNGEMRWRIGAGTFATFGKKGIGLVGEPAFIALAFPRAQGRKPRLFAVVKMVGFSPVKVIELDPSTGHELQVYHHRGSCDILRTVDIDQDGNDELLVAGLNDGFDQACIAVLDPANINGHAPVPPDLSPLEAIPQGKEKYYLLFPRTDLGKALGRTPYNQVSILSITGNSLINVHVKEGPTPTDNIEVGAVVYVFGKDMRIVSVTGDDTFVARYNKYYRMKGSIQFKLDYWNALKDSVKYWDGEKFVNTPTMNKRYRETRQPLP